ncbi:hypothetical protein COOONC_26554 [Cooperia oncophora]
MFTEWNPVKGYIIMEYLEDLKVVHIYENVTPKDLKAHSLALSTVIGHVTVSGINGRSDPILYWQK